MPSLDDLAPEDLSPPTTPRPNKPPLGAPPRAGKERKGRSLLPKVSISRYRPDQHAEEEMDAMLRQRLGTL